MYIIVHYFNSSQVGFSDEIAWTDLLSNDNRKERTGSGLQPNQDLLSVQKYGELGSHLRMYKNPMQGR